MELTTSERIIIGKRGEIQFPSGWYVYVGSALNGIEQRVRRHLSSSKKMHWHIDYLLQNAQIVDVFYKESDKREECIVAQKFSESCHGIEGFGCSDCSCRSHLFYGSEKQLRRIINQIHFLRLNAPVL